MPDTERLRPILDRLCRGDAEAARRAFVEYEPYLRLIVRRQLTAALRAKFDSLDVVQSVWADLLDGFRSGAWRFESPGQLHGFLVRATHNRLIDRLRQVHPVLIRVQNLETMHLDSLATSKEPAVGASLEAEELWQRMLLLCPPRHRLLLALKREGLPLAEIAGRTGLHESSVRRILHELAVRLAAANRDL